VPIRLEIVTPEGAVYADDVDMVIAPASEGYVGILPHHAPLLTTLGPGEFRVKKGGVEETLAVFGGFMDVRGDPERSCPLAVRLRSCGVRFAVRIR
jgi:F-type H+-transporting ATPase subunit epsilon